MLSSLVMIPAMLLYYRRGKENPQNNKTHPKKAKGSGWFVLVLCIFMCV